MSNQGGVISNIMTALRLLVDAPGDLSDADLAALDALRGDIGTRLREERERRDSQPRWRSRDQFEAGLAGLGDLSMWLRLHAAFSAS